MKPQELKHKNETELVEIYRKTGDLGVLEIIYEKYRSKIFKQFKSYVKDKDLAEDLLQDLFVKLQTHLVKYEGKSSFETWLYSTTRNFAYDYIRKQRQQQLLAAANQFMEYEEETEVDTDQHMEQLSRALAQLSSSEKEILILKYAYGGQIDEIADHLSLNLSAAKMRIKRARQKAQDLYLKSL